MFKPATKGLKEVNAPVNKVTHIRGETSNTHTDIRSANSENSFNNMTLHMVTYWNFEWQHSAYVWGHFQLNASHQSVQQGQDYFMLA